MLDGEYWLATAMFSFVGILATTAVPSQVDEPVGRE